MEYGLEVVVLPVSDVDKARDFYQGLGWRLDADFHGSPRKMLGAVLTLELTPRFRIRLEERHE